MFLLEKIIFLLELSISTVSAPLPLSHVSRTYIPLSRIYPLFFYTLSLFRLFCLYPRALYMYTNYPLSVSHSPHPPPTIAAPLIRSCPLSHPLSPVHSSPFSSHKRVICYKLIFCHCAAMIRTRPDSGTVRKLCRTIRISARRDSPSTVGIRAACMDGYIGEWGGGGAK
jgi:hypothetical protein